MARTVSIRVLVVLLCLAVFTPLAHAGTGVNEVPGEAPAAPYIEPAYAVIIGHHETRFPSAGRYGGRAANVRLAALHLNRVILEPGDELSFNEVVGPRSAEAGFEYAPVIANGRIRRGSGGGVCQVATTLHAAALEAGLTVVARRAHSRPSSYIDAGLDATVVDGRVDYRIRNDYDFPVAVRTKATADDLLVIQITGAEQVVPTAVRTQRIRVLPRGERRVEDPTLAAGAEVIEEPGRDGLVVRVISERGDEVHREVVRYAPAPRIVHVGPSASAG